MTTLRSRTLLAVKPLALAVSLSLVTPVAFTQDDMTQLDGMTVTAQKREQQVEEVPLAITAYSGEFLENLGVDGMGELATYVPGFQVQEQSPNNPGFVIRGITSDSGDSTVQPRVSVFQDGVSISRSRGASVALFDMERVEVLRGPQGTLFGRAAETGAVHLIQNKAQPGFDARMQLGYGNHDHRNLEGHVNGTIAEDAFFGRLAFYHDQYDGTYNNLADGSTLGGKQTTALRGSLGMYVGEYSTLDLIFNWQHDTPPGTAFRSGTIPTRQGTTSPFAAGDLNRGSELGLDRELHGITLLGSFGLSDAWTMNTVSAWRNFDSTEEFDADGSQIPALEFAEIAHGKQFSHEFRFNYDNGGQFAGFFGASYFHEDGYQKVPFTTDERSLLVLLMQNDGIRGLLTQQLIAQGALPPGAQLPRPPLLNPDGSPFLGLQLPPGVVLNPHHTEAFANYGTTTAWDVFADGTWRFNDQLELTLGLRGTHEELTGGYQGFVGNAPSLLGGLGAGLPQPGSRNILNLATNGKIKRTEDFDSLVGRASLRYGFADGVSGYVSYARGRRPNVVSVTPTSSEVLPAETVNSYEIGLKGGNARWIYDVTAFYYDYANFQTQRPNPTGGTPLFIPTNGGNASAYGLEAALNVQLIDGLRGFVNYGYVHARFDDEDDQGNRQAYAGNRFRLTPDHSASLGFDWRMPMGAHTLYFRPSYTWQSKVFFEDRNLPGLKQDAYGLVNLRMGMTFANQWEVSLWGRNLTNEQYLIDAGNTGMLFGTPTYVPGTPLMWGVQVSKEF